MQKALFSLILIFLSVASNAQYMSERGNADVQIHLNDLETRVRMLEEQVYNDTVMIERMSKMLDDQQVIIDSLCQVMQIDQKNLSKAKSSLKNDIDGNHDLMINKFDFLYKQINKKSLWAGLVGIGAILLSVVLYFLIRRKNKNTQK